MSDSRHTDAPPRLAAALRQAYDPVAPIPPQLDAAILSAARDHFATQRRRRFILHWSAVTAAAATLLIAATLAIHSPAPSIALRGDLNGDGRVDMVDAFLLAKQLQSGVKPAAADFYHDGVVDDRDVQLLAQAAVSLKPVTLQ
jgi:hypothetical protein